ncbi:allene oxide synthase protein [Genlisea aurea]|uniref:Allene oxide synthase protein n=1 Tax=Genlisea aurea TaxID=192259 RepID=S8CAD2_9LAMI|nr:allene oxide synthase protein [Genlisea aurea]
MAASPLFCTHFPGDPFNHSRPSKSRSRFRAALSETSAQKASDAAGDGGSRLPLREIPGDYGLPLIGPWSDRQDYFYKQGREEFFKSRMLKYQSTVFRANMPPGPFISGDSRVVVLLDGKSFPVLFDADKVEKKDVFTGTFSPSTELTGGYRVLSYLDPSEPNHERLKRLVFFMLSRRRDHVIPEFRRCFGDLLRTLEKEVSTSGKADFNSLNEQSAFNFVSGAFFGADPLKTDLGSDGPGLINRWVLFQLHPVLALGLPRLIEDPILHTFRLPPFLAKNDYRRLHDFVSRNSSPILEEADRLGISREEASHNLVFATCFNAWGGLKILFPNILKWVGRGGAKLHARLAAEIRTSIQKRRPLTESVVYEALRIEPPVSHQYGRARRDFVIESHDGAFRIREGEMLYGYQPMATRDPRIFDRPEEFVPDRFVGEGGQRLLEHLLWSNGPETKTPTAGDKQCAGKDFAVLAGRLLVAEIFRTFDSFDVEVSDGPLGASVTVTSLKRAHR